jgi:hypothetical protein
MFVSKKRKVFGLARFCGHPDLRCAMLSFILDRTEIAETRMLPLVVVP